MSAYLWMWAIFTTYMFFASLRTTAAVALVFLLLAITFILLAIGDMGGGHTSITHRRRVLRARDRDRGLVRVVRGGV